MRYFSEKNLKKIIFASLIILVAILTSVYSTLFVVDKYWDLEEELPKIEADFIRQQKDILQYAVNLQISQIDLHRQQIKAKLKQGLKSKVHDAKAIAQNLYSKNGHKMAESDLQDLILQALRPITFYQGRGYYFVHTMNGLVKLYPSDVSFEGHLAKQVYLGDKFKVFDDLRKIVRSQDEGFLEYDWPLPGKWGDRLYKKLTYVTRFEPYDWLIGAGEYYVDFGDMTRESIVADINNSMTLNPRDYFFVYDLHDINGGKDFATMLVNPNRPDLIGTKLSDEYQGARGKKFRKDFLAGLRDIGEAYVTYWYKKPGDSQPKKKLSYFKLYPEWNWVVAKGVYLDDLEKIISSKKEKLESKVKNKLTVFACLLCFSVIFAVIIAHYFTKGINSIFIKYKNIQEDQHRELERINKFLHKRATIDNLTELHNRQYFNERLEQEVNRLNRYNYSVSLIFFDIDFFKEVNDTFGHLAGDDVLRELAVLVRSHTRQSDCLARWGGEEFVLLVVEADSGDAKKIAENICHVVAAHTFSVARRITCSFGVTQFVPGESIIDFINRTDQGLYQAKELGRNKVVEI